MLRDAMTRKLIERRIVHTGKNTVQVYFRCMVAYEGRDVTSVLLPKYRHSAKDARSKLFGQTATP